MFDFVGGILVGPGGLRGTEATSSERYESLRQDLIEQLKQLQDPANGRYVVRDAYRREEIYSGAHLSAAPDIILVLDPRYRGERSLLTKTVVSQHRVQDTLWSGTHREEGIFMLAGPGIANAQINPHRIWDVSPTILYLLEVPIPSDMDGELIRESIDPDYLAASPPCISDVGEPEAVAAGDAVSAWGSEEELEDVKDHLRGLGYL
jgi:hypothetical protein